LVAAAKFLVATTKSLFIVPNFVAVTKPFFFRAVDTHSQRLSLIQFSNAGTFKRLSKILKQNYVNLICGSFNFVAHLRRIKIYALSSVRDDSLFNRWNACLKTPGQPLFRWNAPQGNPSYDYQTHLFSLLKYMPS